MTISRLFQAATSIGIAAVAGLAATFGIGLILFDADVRHAEAAAAITEPGKRTQWITVAGPAASTENGAALAGWRATPGVGGAARVMLATRAEEHASLPQRLLEITSALSVAPTNGAQWLAFADATLRLGYGAVHALRAYDMATLTARREGDQMYTRALLVLRVWEEMPDDRRQVAMSQLAELRWRIKRSDRRLIATTIADKAPHVRRAILTVLAPKTEEDQSFQRAIGVGK